MTNNAKEYGATDLKEPMAMTREEIRSAVAAILRKIEKKDLSEKTGVSQKSLIWLIQGEEIGEPSTEKHSDRGLKMVRAGARQLVRVWSVMKAVNAEAFRAAKLDTLDFRDVARAFGLYISDRPDLLEVVDDEIRKERHQVDRPRDLDDPVLLDMRLRASDESVEAVVVPAAMVWEPIHGSMDQPTAASNEATQYRENWTLGMTPSFGVNILRRLLGAIGYRWKVEKFKHVTAFDEALDLLIQQPLSAHVLIGLYRNNARTAEGIDFIPLPGLKAQMSAIIPMESKSWLDWERIQMPGDRSLRGVVLQDEASHAFLEGICQYSTDGNIRIPGTLLTPVKSERNDGPGKLIERAANMFLSINSPNRFFCADATTCIYVARQLIRKHHSYAGGEIELKKLEDIGFTLVKTTEWTPVHQIAIAVRADATRLLQLLKDAMVSDLFGTGVYATAEAYIELARRASGFDTNGDEMVQAGDLQTFPELFGDENTPVYFDKRLWRDRSFARFKVAIITQLNKRALGSSSIKIEVEQLKKWFGVQAATQSIPTSVK